MVDCVGLHLLNLRLVKSIESVDCTTLSAVKATHTLFEIVDYPPVRTLAFKVILLNTKILSGLAHDSYWEGVGWHWNHLNILLVSVLLVLVLILVTEMHCFGHFIIVRILLMPLGLISSYTIVINKRHFVLGLVLV